MVTPWIRRCLVGVILAVLATVALGFYLPRHVEQEVWTSELQQDRQILEGMLRDVEVPPQDAEAAAALDRFARSALLVGDYVRVKLWDPDGTVVYSDLATLIGRTFEPGDGLRAALSGRRFTEVSSLDQPENALDRGLADRVLEEYLPVERDGRVVAVWEVYRSLDRFDAAMARVRLEVWWSVGAALALLLVVLTVLLGTLLRALGRENAEATMLSSQLTTLLEVAKETSRSLDSVALARSAVRVIREEADFQGVALLRIAASGEEMLASSLDGGCPGGCLSGAAAGLATGEHGCTTLGVELHAGAQHLLLVAGNPTEVGFTPADEILLRAAGDSLAMAWDHARLYEELTEAQAEQRRLTRELVDAHEEERRTIVGDIHDGLGQTLHRVLYGLRRVQATAANGSGHDELARLEDMTADAIRELRRLLSRLRPSSLEDLGLVPALNGLAATAQEDGGVEVELRSGDLPELAMPVRVAVYRIVQEALHNAVKHGQAHHATVELTVDGDRLMTRVVDDGSGYRPSTSDGLGVWLMRERTSSLGGDFAIHRVDGHGTAVEARLPLEVVP